MPTTPNYGLPYPAPTDAPNVPADLQALAAVVDTQLKTAADADAAWRPICKRKLTGTQSNGTTSPVDDTELYVDLTVGLWKIDADILVNANDATADFTMKWTLTNGLAVVGNSGRMSIGPGVTGTNPADSAARHTSSSLSTSVAYGTGTGSPIVILEKLVLDVSTAGRLRIQWAQNVATPASPVVVGIGSRLIAQRVA